MPKRTYNVGLLCPHCKWHESAVIDSRHVRGRHTIRRRRECLSCGTRFTTYEWLRGEEPVLSVHEDALLEAVREMRGRKVDKAFAVALLKILSLQKKG